MTEEAGVRCRRWFESRAAFGIVDIGVPMVVTGVIYQESLLRLDVLDRGYINCISVWSSQ